MLFLIGLEAGSTQRPAEKRREQTGTNMSLVYSSKSTSVFPHGQNTANYVDFAGIAACVHALKAAGSTVP
jgi:hypothetical protein